MNALPKKVVVLAGAGLAYDAGLPLSVKLAEKLRAHLDVPVSDAEEDTRRAHRSLYNLIVGGLRFQQGVLDRNPEDPINIEQIATTALRLSQRHENPVSPYVSVWHPRLAQIEAQTPTVLTSFLSTIYGQLREWLTPTSSADLGYLASLSDLHNDRSALDIFSLNYDLCIERAFSDLAEREFINGFDTSGWRADLLRASGVIRLVKLHGSLDWVDDSSGYGICSLEYPRHTQSEELEGRTPLLIFGTDHKLTGRDPFLTLFYHFASALRECCATIIVGYSFGDPHINEILEQRFRENIRMRVLIVSPGATEQAASHDWLANPSRVTAINSTAKTALNEKRILKWVNDELKKAKDETPF
jgi:hypothetical protein